MRLLRKYTCILFLLPFLQLAPNGWNSCAAENLTDTVPLTAAERLWLQAHPVITLAPDADFRPIEYIDKNGIYQGAAADIIRLLERRLGITITIVHLKNWDEVMAKFKNHEVDMLGAMVKTPKREEFSLFTDTIVSVPGGIFTNSDNNDTLTLGGLSGKKVAVVSNYTAHDILKNHYPDIILDVVPDVSTGLAKASLGMVDAYVENMANATYYARDAAISNLRLAGMTDFTYHWGIGIRKDWPELQGILNKGLAAISEGEREQIIRRYVSIDDQRWRPTKTMVLSSAAALLTVLLLLVVYWNLSLRKVAAERKKMVNQSLLLTDIITRSQDFIGVADADMITIYVNPAGMAMVGLDGNDAAKKTKITDYFFAEDLPFIERTILPALMTDGRWAGEFRFRHFKTGEPVHVMFDLFRTKDAETGEVRNYTTITRNINEYKRVESEKEALSMQLMQAQKLEAIGLLAGGVAHDFNNMLGVILGHSELAMKRLDVSEPIYTSLKSIHTAAERSADLTRQLLAFARKQTIAPKVLNLNQTIEGMVSMLTRLIGEDIDLAWRPGRNLGAIKMDPSQIDQILVNLCVNARDAIVDTGKVTIETNTVTFDAAYCAMHADFVPGEYVLLAVSDNGCGIDPETVSHLFEPFFTTKDTGKGTGLGLATVYGIVKQNKGFINVYSELDQGTTFKVYLPLYATTIEQTELTGAAVPAVHGHETILLVEDDSLHLEITKNMLETQGYTVFPAATPNEAIRIAGTQDGKIDLLITDVIMPEMNGRDLSRDMLSLYPKLKCLFMSGYTANVIAHHGVLDVGIHFVQKPFSMNDLAAKVREALE